jgi:hypothetical protein
MDIAGAKALKKSLATSGVEAEAEAAAPVEADVAGDAPPVYQWTGVSQAQPESESADAEDEPDKRAGSMLRRFGLSSR